MDGVQSFEHRSANNWDGSHGNRVIIVNRREPNLRWLTASEAQANSEARCLSNSARKCCLAPFTCSCFKSAGEPEKSLNKHRARRRPSDIPSTVSDSELGSGNYQAAAGPTETFNFGPFPSNKWKTSKYTLINFLPKNLYEQFRRLANFYFLITAILQIIMPFSPVGPSTSLIPLLFVVSTTAIKQAYEDYLRHKLDNQVNERSCNILREDKTLVGVCSKDIRVGDVVYVKNNEEIPCDMILLASSGSGDRCYITTANLDGETSLKSRTCFQVRQQIGNIEQINETLLVVECEKPSATLYEFNGFLRAPKDAQAYEILMRDVKHLDELKTTEDPFLASSTSQASNQSLETQSAASSQLQMRRLSVISTIFRRLKQAQLHSRIARHMTTNEQQQQQQQQQQQPQQPQQQQQPHRNERLVNYSAEHTEIPLDISNLLLRASRLRNTSHIYGLAVYTGRDTRLSHNSHVKPNKFSSLESRVNMFLGMAFAILVALSLISSLKYEQTPAGQLPANSSAAAAAAATNRATRKPESFLEIFAAQFMLYNYLVPISLYVTLEFVKFFSTISVLEDKKLQACVWTTESNVAAHSDQQQAPGVATLAAPALNGRQHSRRTKTIIGPQCNSSDLNEDLGQVEVLFSDKTGTLTENKMHFMACSIDGRLFRLINNQLFEQPEGLCYMPALNVVRRLSGVRGNRYAAIASELSEHHGPRSALRSLNASSRSSKSSLDRLARLPAQQRPFDHRSFPPVKELNPIDNLENHHQVAEFFLQLCLCSTITINEQLTIEECLKNNLLEHNDYQSASPDEESLITAAALLGVIIAKSSEREFFLAVRRRTKSPASPTGGSGGAARRHLKSTSGNKEQLGSNGRGGNGFCSKENSQHQHQQAARAFKFICKTKLSNERYMVRHFERLVTFEFNSTRKKMSVLYRDCDNDCMLLITKGSESVLDCISINEHMGAQAERSIDSIMAHFEAFSKSGLRTMLVARRSVDRFEYEKLVAEMRDIRLMSTHEARNESLATLYKQVESNMNLVGATAVEDCLQEGVPETIADLREAGIKVWLLTGDKVETAISVAYLCKLMDRNMNLLALIRQQDSRACKEMMRSFVQRIQRTMAFGDDELPDVGAASTSSNGQRESVVKRPKSLAAQQQRGQRPEGGFGAGKADAMSQISDELDLPRFALVADGRSLHYAMKHAKQELEFISSHCACVLGCRLSPLQKAEIVDLIKNGERGPITAAIGDGANDVSMIQEAHVGIGISGKEGRQAVNSSDFSVNRFHMLSRLFFVHGHLFYHRTANTIHYFFYKSFLFIIPQFIYSFYNLSSATSLYHPTMLISYNMAFTSVPILLYGLTEVSIPEQLLESRPRLYRMNMHNEKMRYRVFIGWILLGSIQGTIAFYSIYFVWGSHTSLLESPGIFAQHLGFSLTLFFTIVTLATVKLYLVSKRRTWSFNLTSILSCAMLPVIFYLLSLVNLSSLFKDNSLQGQVWVHLRTPLFWLTTLGAVAAAVIPDILMFIRDQLAYHQMINSVINMS